MVLMDCLAGIPSPKLHVPHMFKVLGCFGLELVSALGDTKGTLGRVGQRLEETLVLRPSPLPAPRALFPSGSEKRHS